MSIDAAGARLRRLCKAGALEQSGEFYLAVEKANGVNTSPKKPAPPTIKRPDRNAAGLPIQTIDPHPFNPRTEFDAAELDRLAESLRTHRLLQPVLVREAPDGRYQLIAGERRLRAAEKAGWKNVPAIVRDVSDAEALVLGLVENIERRDLNPIEKARGLARLCAPAADGGGGLTQEQAAAMFKHGKEWACNLMRLLTLPDVWQQRIAAGELSEAHARALVPYAKRPAVLARIEDDLLANPWSWRTRDDFERNAALLAETAETKPAPPAELKPMRAAPGSGERQRESRAKAATPAAALLHVEPVMLKFPAEGERSSAVRAIVEAIAGLVTQAELDEVATAIDDRRRRIALKA